MRVMQRHADLLAPVLEREDEGKARLVAQRLEPGTPDFDQQREPVDRQRTEPARMIGRKHHHFAAPLGRRCGDAFDRRQSHRPGNQSREPVFEDGDLEIGKGNLAE